MSTAGLWRPGQADDEVRRALGELAETYWPPLYAWARRGGADLVQGFFAELHLDALCDVREPGTSLVWSAGLLRQGAEEASAWRVEVDELLGAAETALAQR